MDSMDTVGSLSRDRIRDLMGAVLAVQGKSLPESDATPLQDLGFRSLDFSELALRVEDEVGAELNFEAAGLRSITTVADVLDLLHDIQDGAQAGAGSGQDSQAR